MESARKKPRLDAFELGLGDAQLKAFARITAGQSVFLTGSAGSGKTELLKRLTQYWTANRVAFALTASTGIAAVQIGARTFHSMTGLQPDDEDPDVTAEHIYARLKKGRAWNFYYKLFTRLRVLVVDEISMIDPRVFQKASDVFKLVRHRSGAFGGIQLVLVGDFFQLPSVYKGSPSEFKFLFELPFFYEAVQHRVVLDRVWRQADPAFVALLGRMRIGALTDADTDVLRGRVGADVTRFGIEPTELWSTNKDVDRLNADKLSQIKSAAVTFERVTGVMFGEDAKDGGSVALDKFVKDTKLPETLVLKGPDGVSTGAQVMLTFNLDSERSLVNGSRGVVVGFGLPPEANCVKPSAFHNFDPDDRWDLQAYIQGMQLPKVRFIGPDGKPLTVLVPYVRWSRKASAEGLASKMVVYAWAIPLKLAWATTVHKSQGQSLDCVKASLDKTVFADGQAYVAVSRCRTLEGLSLTAFEPSVVRANERVVRFYADSFEAAAAAASAAQPASDK